MTSALVFKNDMAEYLVVLQLVVLQSLRTLGGQQNSIFLPVLQPLMMRDVNTMTLDLQTSFILHLNQCFGRPLKTTGGRQTGLFGRPLASEDARRSINVHFVHVLQPVTMADVLNCFGWTLKTAEGQQTGLFGHATGINKSMRKGKLYPGPFLKNRNSTLTFKT